MNYSKILNQSCGQKKETNLDIKKTNKEGSSCTCVCFRERECVCWREGVCLGRVGGKAIAIAGFYWSVMDTLAEIHTLEADERRTVFVIK